MIYFCRLVINCFDSIFQTQTFIPQTKEASVLAEVTVLSESKCVQVDSLTAAVNSPSLLSPSPQLNQSLPPPPALPPQYPSGSFKLEFQTPSHLLQTPSDTGTRFVHTFDTPNEIVNVELKDIEMNKTIHSMEVQESDEGADSSVERKLEKVIGHAKDKEDRRASLPLDKQVNQTLDEKGRSDMKEVERSNYFSQKAVANHLNSVPVASLASKAISRNYDNMTIDKLYEEFCDGNISVEDFYQRSINIPVEEEVRGDSLPKMNKKSIQALEQEVSEVAQSINESQHLVSRVRQLMENTEVPERDKFGAQSYRPHEKFSESSSLRQCNDVEVAISLTDNMQWQEALSVCRKQGKLDALIQFFDANDFENITSDMVDEIIEFENSIQSKESQKSPGCMKTDFSILLHKKGISKRTFAAKKEPPLVGSDDGFFNKAGNPQDPVQKETQSTASSDLTKTEEWQKSPLSGSELSELHLNLANIRLVVYFSFAMKR